MLKRFSVALIAFVGLAVWVHAQDAGLPALPPLPGQDVSANSSSALPPLPGDTTSSSASALPPVPGDTASSSASALPPVPGETASPAASGTETALPSLPNQESPATAQPALPQLPSNDNTSVALSDKDQKKQKKEAEKIEKQKAKELAKLNKDRKKKGLEPLAELPKEGGVAASAPTVATTSNALPPVPGSGTTTAATDALPPVPGAEAAVTPGVEAKANTTTTESKPKVKQAKKPIQKWHAPDFGPNVILGGLVRTKGGTIEEKLAWVSQHILNGMDFHGYEVQKEEGAYAGQLVDKEWRQFTFQARKKKSAAPVVIYVEPATGDSVWLRVGPSEPPAGVPAKDVRQIRLQNQQVLTIMKHQLKGALKPVGGRWEMPYRRVNG